MNFIEVNQHERNVVITFGSEKEAQLAAPALLAVVAQLNDKLSLTPAEQQVIKTFLEWYKGVKQ